MTFQIGKPVFIVAEAGVNHNGKFDNAIKLIDRAKKSGADAIKFQIFKTKSLVCQKTKTQQYQIHSTDILRQDELLENLELTYDEFTELNKYCKRKKIIFFATPFDEESLNLLISLDVPVIKVSSGDLTNHILLKQIARTKLPVILSTGMATIEEISDATKIFERKYPLCLLHCVSLYPTPVELANLKRIKLLKETFDLPIGYSDHTLGIASALGAVASGAVLLEKHFTLSKTMEGPDHLLSLEPLEFRNLVLNIRLLELALSKNPNFLSREELKMKKLSRRSLVTKQNIKKGEIITEEKLTAKRPETGISPRFLHKVVGKKATKNIGKDEIIKWEFLEKR